MQTNSAACQLKYRPRRLQIWWCHWRSSDTEVGLSSIFIQYAYVDIADKD